MGLTQWACGCGCNGATLASGPRTLQALRMDPLQASIVSIGGRRYRLQSGQVSWQADPAVQELAAQAARDAEAKAEEDEEAAALVEDLDDELVKQVLQASLCFVALLLFIVKGGDIAENRGGVGHASA